MMKPKLMRHNGAAVFGAEVDLRSMRPWDPTVPQVRETILAKQIVGPDLTSLPMALPGAKEFAPSQREVELMNELSFDAITQGRLIDFGMLPNELMKFGGNRGGPLWNMGGFGQPFSDPWLLYHTWERGACLYLVNPKDNGNLEVCEFQPATIADDKILMIADRGLFIRQPEKELAANKYHCAVAPAVIRFLQRPPGFDDINNGGAPGNAAAGNIGDPVMCALMILNTRNVPRETVAVGERLNRARRKSGKLPIPPFDRVLTAEYVTAIMTRGARSARSEDRGGSHASPIPHLRLGHPRQYATGRSIFIRDTLVNVPPEQRAAFKSQRTHYTVER